MNQGADIGDQLRSAREVMGLSLAQAAERLHVDVAVLSALESGSFMLLGAPVFVRGHLRRYAELLGAPAAELQAQYSSMQEASLSPDLTNVPHLPAQPGRHGMVRWQLITVAIVLLLVAVAWWAVQAKPP
ncbi:MAG: helix-turn-helix domain-containing protein [Steroidobacteraceae bacterium]